MHPTPLDLTGVTPPSRTTPSPIAHSLLMMFGSSSLVRCHCFLPALNSHTPKTWEGAVVSVFRSADRTSHLFSPTRTTLRYATQGKPGTRAESFCLTHVDQQLRQPQRQRHGSRGCRRSHSSQSSLTMLTYCPKSSLVPYRPASAQQQQSCMTLSTPHS